MDVKLYRAYVSHWDNIEYPIFQLADGAYLCIAYSFNHKNYWINTYTKEEFSDQGFKECDGYDDYFETLITESILL